MGDGPDAACVEAGKSLGNYAKNGSLLAPHMCKIERSLRSEPDGHHSTDSLME
jgi:hypothetical protein